MRGSINRPPTPDTEEDREQELSLQEIINIKMIESGELERLKELLRERLIECGWRDEMKSICRAFVRKKGRNNVNVDDLIQVMAPKGRGEWFFVVSPFSRGLTPSIPDSVKAELLHQIQTFLKSAIP
ncbi:hypothetical protein GIB67_002861 [Kingdonia uniflora]|uniref:Transcription and mRNA export factor ENY2 n=1 Tax=Kingdonia uniflora TaxID=39325 RepID=A0A7J7M5B1_9MAGN|nr:hypothetical protein GIB67_002861 [Kingdonia uniflora]